MKIIRFSRGFLPAALFSFAIIVFGAAGYFVKGGFNLGIDFQAGLIQEVQFAPRAFALRYEGPGNALISLNRTTLFIAISGAGVQGQTWQYLLADYPDTGALGQALAQIEGISIENAPSGPFAYRSLALDTLSNPALGSEPCWIHYVPQNAAQIPVDKVRSALTGFGSAAVQVAGNPSDNHFVIRMQESDMEASIASGKARTLDGAFDARNLSRALEDVFGEGELAVTSSNLVGSRFSKNLTSQAGVLLGLTLLLILAYASIRFRPQYATGAALAILHDGLVMVAFVVWTRMEFNTTTIAAILTILGYSINDTIVIFDRIRETRRIFPDDTITELLNRSISETLSRTFITTLTTMLAVLSLYIFTTGSMKDFALVLLVGMTSGVYSTIYIACGFVSFWERFFGRRSAPQTSP